MRLEPSQNGAFWVREGLIVRSAADWPGPRIDHEIVWNALAGRMPETAAAIGGLLAAGSRAGRPGTRVGQDRWRPRKSRRAPGCLAQGLAAAVTR
jgi:hypothetical protein